jgi:hypothetical protein
VNDRLLNAIAVGLPVAQQPPHKSRRAELSHRAFQKYSYPQKASRQAGSSSRQSTFRTIYDMRFSNAELLNQLNEANSIVTLSLAALVQVFPQRSDCMEIERIEAE